MDRDRQDFLDGATVLILRATIPIFFVWFPNKCIKNTNIDGKNKACDSIKSHCGDDPSLFPNYLYKSPVFNNFVCCAAAVFAQFLFIINTHLVLYAASGRGGYDLDYTKLYSRYYFFKYRQEW